MINKILFITLSNIGDVILSLPSLDFLRENFPEAKITVMVGPRPASIFKDNPFIDRLIIYDKHANLRNKIKLFKELKKENFDIVVDLRNSFFGVFLPARYKISPFLFIPKSITHMQKRHLYKAQSLKLKTKSSNILSKSLYIGPKDKEYIENIFKENDIKETDKIIVISAGARSRIKRWDKDKFKELIPFLSNEFKAKIILVGDKDDILINKYIEENLKYPVLNLTAQTSLSQLAELLKKASFLITNDSAVLHLASYLNIPTVAIFGPTDEEKYGPWSKKALVIKKDIFCRPCQKAECRFSTLDCLKLIKVEDVLSASRKILLEKLITQYAIHNTQYKRILIVRTDRIGDVVLSTPVIKAIRDNYPTAYIAMMVSPFTSEIVEGNPYLDEVIIYDKLTKHRSFWGSLKFSFKLRKKRFDLAIILHPTNRVHLVTFFARIPKRIGYNRKLGLLLTDRLNHTKHLGQKHELEYNLDLVRYLGIEPEDKNLFMPIKPQSEAWVEEMLKKEGITKTDKLVAIHPGASCPSKIWPVERFAEVANKLIEKYGFKVIIISGPKDISLGQKLTNYLHYRAVNLSGQTSLSQLASLLKRCSLFISNDSGPVHIASAVGTPVISIFGRNQKGLSPLRWGPVGKKDKVLHKEIGCIQCLAHNCKKDFACLKAISVEEVLDCVDQIIKTDIINNL